MVRCRWVNFAQVAASCRGLVTASVRCWARCRLGLHHTRATRAPVGGSKPESPATELVQLTGELGAPNRSSRPDQASAARMGHDR
jgi:hypothetical protein